MIAIVDYGMGNICSVEQALKYIGAEYIVTDDREEILRSDGVILPGVGAFPKAMDVLEEKISICAKRDWEFRETVPWYMFRYATFI